jgi:uncharacterized protein (DUF1501 family)
MTMAINLHAPSRRELLLSSGVLFAWACMPKLALAEGRDPRFLAFILRGALDGLATVAPVGDPDWVRLRGNAGLSLQGPPAALPLDGFFALNPAMPNLHRMYKAGHATIVHAVASPYRDRSHFDGQDVLESGLTRPGAADSGWLNRALATLAPAGPVGSQASPKGREAFAVGPITPLVVRGVAPVMSWTPARLPPPTDNMVTRLLDLYRHTDPALAHVLEERMDLAAISRDGAMMAPSRPQPPAQPGQQAARPATPPVPGEAQRRYFAESAGAAAKFLARADGPRIGALSFDGWDTHANEGAASGRLSQLLGALDGALAAVESGMGPAWSETVVAVMTEFGRTARINGTEGTDHGTGTIALLVGGAVKGGRVIADWPGLKEADLRDGRDLKPTTDLRAILKGVLRDHVRVDDKALASTVFPDSTVAKALGGLVA